MSAKKDFSGLTRAMERLPAFLGWGLLTFTLAVLVIMPISGGWLLVPPAFGLVARGRHRAA